MTHVPSFDVNTTSTTSDLLSAMALAELGLQMAEAQLIGAARDDSLALSPKRSHRARVQAAGLRERARLNREFAPDLNEWYLKVLERLQSA